MQGSGTDQQSDSTVPEQREAVGRVIGSQEQQLHSEKSTFKFYCKRSRAFMCLSLTAVVKRRGRQFSF